MRPSPELGAFALKALGNYYRPDPRDERLDGFVYFWIVHLILQYSLIQIKPEAEWLLLSVQSIAY